MMAITHACIATAGASLILSTSDPLILGLAIVGSQLPDIDNTRSIIGQVCFPIASWIEDRYPHRTLTHSLVATAGLTALTIFIGWLLGDVWMLLALPLGHGLSCFSDTFTRQGVQLFWPEPVWAVSVSNPNRRLRTGGPGEYWVLSGAIALLLIGLQVAGSGGVNVAVGGSLGLRDTAIATYNASPEQAVYADIEGVWVDDRSSADGSYLILKRDGNEFLVTDGSGIYHTGQSMVVDSLKARAAEPLQSTTERLNFADEEPTATLQQLAIAHPGKRVYLSGVLTVDYPEGLVLQPPGRSHQTAVLTGETLTLDMHPLELATVQLTDQWVTGSVMVMVQ